MSEKVLGILGGIGPLATVCFMDMIVRMTKAQKDQDHISMIVCNDASIPDRTEYILDGTKPDPLPVMIADAKKLQSAGADFIVMPCNTAHYFYERIQKNIDVPMLNIIEETVLRARSSANVKKLGVLATDGTIISGAYQKVCEKYSLACEVPDERDRRSLMDIIYNQVKAGKNADISEFLRIIGNMKKKGCDAVALGCTELSVINDEFARDIEAGGVFGPDRIVDSMRVLAERSILICGKELKD